jgi:cholest-4-en-3-one 26-monooxygenase
MRTQLTRTDIRILDPETYGKGDPATYGLPLDHYDYVRQETPCYLEELSNPLLMERVWVITRHEDVWNVDRDPETWAANLGYVNTWRVINIDPIEYQGAKPAMLSMDGADHRRNRDVISRAFTPTAIAKLEEKFRHYAREVVDKALKLDGPFDFVHEIAGSMPMEALGDVLGVPPQDRAKFFGWVDTFAAPFDERVAPTFEALENAIQSLMDYALELADIRRREPGDDVMSKINEAGKGVLSEDELMGNVSLLANGAAESTRNTLSHGMHQLMRDPDQWAWLREHAGDVPLTVAQELVRIATPFIHLVRTATRDVELHGQEIKQGERVALMFPAGNFDPEAFDDPRRMDLSRDPNPHVSFGRGPHSCLGKHVAALEIKILLEELAQRVKEVRPAGDIVYVRDNFSRGVLSLPVTLVPA